MQTLKGKHIYLRPLELVDLSFVYEIENNENYWEISNTITPYSKYILKQYLENSHRDIFDVKQLRLVICTTNNSAIGMIDLFDFDFKNRRAGVGILLKDKAYKKKGYGTEALQLLVKYSFTHLNLHQLYCNITEDNTASIQLFLKVGFQKVGLKKDWNFSKGKFKNVVLFQLINTKNE